MQIETREGFTLSASEQHELKTMRAYAPFREWFAVKPQNQPAAYFDSRRKANGFAKKNAPAAIFKCEAV